MGADAFVMGGRVGASLQSANSGYQVDADIQAANDTQRFKVGAMLQSGDDMAFPGGGILPTEYERQRYDIGYGHRFGDHSVQLDYGYNDTGETGTPALPMDIDYIEGDLYDLRAIRVTDRDEIVAFAQAWTAQSFFRRAPLGHRRQQLKPN